MQLKLRLALLDKLSISLQEIFEISTPLRIIALCDHPWEPLFAELL